MCPSRYLCLPFVLLTVSWSHAQALSSQSAGATNDRVVARFEAGRRASQAGQFDRAVEEYKAALRLDPNLVEARFNLGLAYHSLGQYSLAIAELEKALRQRPSLVAANLFLGIDYLKLGLPREAAALLQAALRSDPSNREAQRALATCFLEQDQYANALERFRALASSDADPSEGLYALGQSYLELAKQLSMRMSEHHQESAWANRLAGDLLAERQQWTDAAVLYQKAVALDSNQPGLHASLGSMYLHQGKRPAAEEEFRRDLELDSKNERALLGLAELQLANGAGWAALASVAKIWEVSPPFLARQTDFLTIKLTAAETGKVAAELEKAPETPAKYFLLSSLYHRQAGEIPALSGGKAPQVWAVFAKEVAGWKEKPASKPESVASLCHAHLYIACASRLQTEAKRSPAENVLLGEVSLEMGEDSQAADAFASALASDRTNQAAMYWLARTYSSLANESLERLVEHFPDSWRAHQFRGQAAQLRYAYDEAIQEFQLAIRAKPGVPELHEALGRLYYLKKLFPRAEQELRTTLKLDPTRASTLFLLGRAQLDENEAQGSIPYLQAALRYDPGLLEARAALGQAYMRTGQAERAVPELEKAASTDTYGDLHYLLYVAYRKLGKKTLAQKALALSQELRKSSAAHHQEKVDEAQEEENPQ